MKPRSISDTSSKMVQAIGRVTVEWVHVQGALNESIRRLALLELGAADIMLHRIDDNVRAQILVALFRYRCRGPGFDAAVARLERLIVDVRACGQSRNEIVHGEWLGLFSEEQAVRSYRTVRAGRLESVPQLFKKEDVYRVADQIIDLHARYMKFMRKWIPRPETLPDL